MTDQEPPQAVKFTALDADSYELLMGRWSRRLALPLIEFGGLADGDRVLDVGCGPGVLTFVLPEAANIHSAVGIDLASVYIDRAALMNRDTRLSFQMGDACSLPFADATFDCTYSLLVLQFIPDVGRAVAEMRRVVRPGGTVTAAVWDSFSGLPQSRMLWDVAATLNPDGPLPWPLFRPPNAPDELASIWRQLGLEDVEQTSLLVRMEFSSFDDYWASFDRGEGPQGQYVASLAPSARSTLVQRMRRAYEANRPDGPRSFVAVAWACRGIVPRRASG